MNRFVPVLLVLAAILLATVCRRPAVSAAPGDDAPLRIARFNISRVLAEAPQMKRLQAEISLVYGPRKAKLRRQIEDLKRSLAALPNSAVTRAEKMRRQQSLLIQLQKLQKEAAELNAAADERKLASLRKFQRTVSGACDRLCREHAIDLLMAETTLAADQAPSAAALAGAMSNRAVWTATERVEDLTEAVLAAIAKEAE